MRSLTRQTARILISILLAASSFASGPLLAQNASSPDYVPQVGQQGKDVIWVPTPQALVEHMLDMARVTPKDYVVDLGSGDGRTVIAAAKRGARALGIEYDPGLVALAKRNAEKAGVSGNAHFIQSDLFKTDFSDADVLTLYLLPSLNLKLRPTILKMRPGTRVVSHAFTMYDWRPDQTHTAGDRTAYMWIVPAPVEGTWQLSISTGRTGNDELVLRQWFQYAQGLVRINGKTSELGNVRIQGTQISFTIFEPAGGDPLRRDFTGRVFGNTMEGVLKLPEGEQTWRTTRVPPPAKR
ncbi:MAG: class I SAM-dependent methyltransferase [Betaproteobacteria bacterium]|nr:class I SAM-dependent methyltransferase [Betaproteobacteria bacterium]MDH3437364.1 class I SAM-dependent methyltransferase [Betaproteobacteria bacterium]